jgi:hypothetical protein
MVEGIEFQEDTQGGFARETLPPKKSSFGSYLVKWGWVKNETTANYVLLGVALGGIAVAAYLIL